MMLYCLLLKGAFLFVLSINSACSLFRECIVFEVFTLVPLVISLVPVEFKNVIKQISSAEFSRHNDI